MRQKNERMIPMLYKFGTEGELEAIKGKIPKELYQTALKIVKTIDEHYGASRDIDNSDGGYLLILENVQDIEQAVKWHIRLDGGNHEHINLVKCAGGDYINALYVLNNEYGVNVFLPKEIALKILLDDLEG